MGPRTERRHQQGEESRQRILDATIEIAAERGYEGTSISLVSRRSGLPASSIYWHFASKDELLAAVIDRSFGRWLASLPDWEPPAPGSDLADHIRQLWRRTSQALIDNQDFLRLGLMLSLERRPDELKARTRFLEARAQAFERLVEAYRRVITWKGRTPDEEVCRTLATFNLAVADGLFIEAQIRPDPVRSLGLFDFMSELMSDLVDRAIGAAPVPASTARSGSPPGPAR